MKASAFPGEEFWIKSINSKTCCGFMSSRGSLVSGRTYEALIDVEVDVGDVREVKFRWNNHVINPLKPKYGASKVELQSGLDKKV